MSKQLLLFIAISIYGSIHSQVSTNGSNTPAPSKISSKNVKVKMEDSKDEVMINFTIDNVIAGGNGDSSYRSSNFNPNLGLYFLYDIPLGKSGISIAPGLGLTFSKVNLDNSILFQDSLGTRFLDRKNHPDFIGNQRTYDGSSFYTSWLEVPFELRYKSKPINGRSCIKVALGMRGGIRIGSNSKISYIDNSMSRELTEKQTPYADLNSFRYGATFRIGYGALNLFGYYGLNQLIKDSRNVQNQDLRQYSVGISITGM